MRQVTWPAPYTRVVDSDDDIDLERAKKPAVRAVSWMAIVGAALGIAAGLLGATVFTATGITGADLPPLNATPSPSATPTPTPTPTPTQTSEPGAPEPQLFAESDRVPPGQRFRLSGILPSAADGTTLQVQVRDGEGPWDDFPVTTQAAADGKFETIVYTSRTGERGFRIIDPVSGDATPEVRVTIG